MIGPSSSHTAGAARLGRIARQLLGKQPTWADITLYGSFAKTYKGHGTDVALVGGLLDYDTFDERIVNALSQAGEDGLDFNFIESDDESYHPNTVRIRCGDDQSEVEMVGASIGGGKIEIIDINGFSLSLSGSEPTLFVLHEDKFGAIAVVASLLAKYQLNISHMVVSRKERGKLALMVIETDVDIPKDVVTEIIGLPHMFRAAVLS